MQKENQFALTNHILESNCMYKTNFLNEYAMLNQTNISEPSKMQAKSKNIFMSSSSSPLSFMPIAGCHIDGETSQSW